MNPSSILRSGPRSIGGRVARLAAIAICCSILGCARPLGGWDLDPLLAAEPGLAELGGHRLGDLIPFPIPMGDYVALVSCRWPSREPIRVRLRLGGDRVEWARRALASIEGVSPGIRFEVVSDAQPIELAANRSFSGIDIVDVEPARGRGPAGAGDTLLVCRAGPDRSPDRRADGGLHPEANGDALGGTPVHAEIRMRYAVFDQIDEVVALPAEAWTGALMHELGHALGFQGHPRGGDTIMVREQSRLRRAGRSALAGRAWKDETLQALYRLEPGRKLGQRVLSGPSRRWLALVDARMNGVGEGPRVKVGDRHSDLEWRTQDGVELRLRFPFWASQLEAGDPLIALPASETRAAILGNDLAGELRDSLEAR